jgi:NNP family nitrate/nitrite transporter-like MFS transporter
MAKDILKWDPENEAFWESEGKSVAWKTLWISIPCLFCGFAVWIYWSVITVQMLNLGFPFSKGDLFTLNAIAGLSRCHVAHSLLFLYPHIRRP